MISKQKKDQEKYTKHSFLAKLMLFAMSIFLFSPTANALAAQYSFNKADADITYTTSENTTFTKIPLAFSGKIAERSISVEMFADNCSVKPESVVLFSELTPSLQDASNFGLTGNYVQETFHFNPDLNSNCATLTVVDSVKTASIAPSVKAQATQIFVAQTEPVISNPTLAQNNNQLPEFMVASSVHSSDEYITVNTFNNTSLVAVAANILDTQNQNNVQTNLFEVLRC